LARRGTASIGAETIAGAGRPASQLLDEELLIVCGFVVFCAEHHQTCAGKNIVNFIAHAFGVTVLKTWVSARLKELHITSHCSASLKYTYGGNRPITAAAEYLRKHQPRLAKVKDRSRVVAMDQMSIWDCGVTERTYSPVGACVDRAICVIQLTLPAQGGSQVWDCDLGQKHILYVAVTADGRCLPPVIFLKRSKKISTDPTGPVTDEEGNVGYVLYIPDLGSPSEKSTQAWLHELTKPGRNYLGDNPHIILDALSGHHAPGITQDWKDIGATLY
jgi:hypothetical protein